MDQESTRVPGQRERLVLGYFLQLHSGYYHRSLSSRFQPSHAFVSTCPEGNDLKLGKLGALDESLNFVAQNAYIVGSSNGFLLCYIKVEEKEQFVICNPVSREYRVVPESNKPYGYVSVAFICKGDYHGISSMETVNYEIFLAQLSTSYEMTSVLDLQIFSSETDEWNSSCIESPLPFILEMCAGPATVLDEMVYYKAGGYFVAYNRCNGLVEVLELPHPDDGDNVSADDVVLSDRLGASNGKLLYACSLMHRLELWELEECVGSRADWNLKHSVSHRTMVQDNPNLKKRSYTGTSCTVKSLHPQNPHLVMMFMGINMYCYDMVAEKLEELGTDFNALPYISFPYEWPSNPLLDVSNVPTQQHPFSQLT